MIGHDGAQIGILPCEEALKKAKEAGLDLVLVAENANPPVCRIMDFGKFIYQQKRKSKEQKRHQHVHKLKEIKFKLNIDQHDFDVKINHAIEFLEKGNKVKFTVIMRGREMAHKEIGFDLINRVLESVKEHGHPDTPVKMAGHSIVVTCSPGKKH